MSVPVSTTIPLIGQLGALVQWLLLLNIVLIGLCVIFGHRAIALSRRVRELEERFNSQASPPGDTGAGRSDMP
ncbi:MAG: hypothetical protein N2111_10065 [Candidatus Sumerlaeaceae bacterium]|nr:hypothetical protein [Candidatus Sumerlaeaceae bacterium]